MKKILTLLVVLFAFQVADAQITVTNADFASSGDTIRYSNASPLSQVDVTLTGANYTWDFSTLQSTSQDVDTFISVTSTPFVYVLVFGFNSNIASRGFDLSALPAVPVSDVYNFFNKSSSNYKQTGYGATISGVTTPISFNNDDIIYDFPVNFGNVDSSDSDYSLVIPGLASAIGSQHRVNNVDGWGSVTTPYGTFNALRIVSTLTGEDSLYLDTLGTGFSAERPLTRQYKWLANGQDIPVLEIITTETFGVENVSSIRYRDSVRTLTTGISQSLVLENKPVLSPNPSRNNDVMATIQLQSAADVTVSVSGADGRLIDRKLIQLGAGKQSILVKPAAFNLSEGLYFVTFNVGNEHRTVKMIVE